MIKTGIKPFNPVNNSVWEDVENGGKFKIQKFTLSNWLADVCGDVLFGAVDEGKL